MVAQSIFGRAVRGCAGTTAVATPVSTVTEIVLVLPRVTLEGVTLQVEFAGAPAQANVTTPGTFATEPSNNGYTAF